MTMYSILFQEKDNWPAVYEEERDSASLAEAAVAAHRNMPPDWELISVREKENPYLDQEEVK